MKKKIAVFGASGYTGWELIKLLAPRSELEIIGLESQSHAGRPVRDLYPEADPDLRFTNLGLEKIKQLNPDLVFLCQADGFAAAHASEFDCRVIDLSRDLRFTDGVVYGLPEINRAKIRVSPRLANPGCYATACILSALPAVQAGLVERIVFDCKSGFSGAGRTPSSRNDPERLRDNVLAYRLCDHPHQPEICRGLGFAPVSFTPHVLPFFRGILATGHFFLKRKTAASLIREQYLEFYAAEPFIRILDRIPDLNDVQHTNLCCLGGFEADEANRLVVVAALDNLIKGASGQAVQNMNLMLGFSETEGLPGI